MNTDWNLIIGIGGFVLAIVGIALSVYFYLKAKEAKEPQCFYITYRDIEKLSQEDKLKITYADKEVERVSTSYVFFWNKGRKPILKADIQKPLIINMVDDSEILDFRILTTTRSNVMDFDAKLFDKNSIELSFDYLDMNDGAVIEIKHTGTYSSKIEIAGIVLGLTEEIKCRYLRKIRKTKYLPFFKRLYGSEYLYILILLILATVSSWFQDELAKRSIFAIDETNRNIFIMIFFLVGLILLVILYVIRNYVPYPKNLDINIDE